ncbi:hypothetical protein TWF718_008165 [Orbilia javanica]|uniref:Uncharacterized protein n=1 Tax=Orbilia javanica TaxID=47235 RepID=A0AAN8RCW7_9PEZI
MPRRSKAASAATESLQRTDPPRSFYVVCRACRDDMELSVIGHSSKYQGTFIIKDKEVMVFGYDPENPSISCHWRTKVRSKLKKADGEYCPARCARCGSDIGRIYTYLPFYPDVEGLGRIALFKDRIRFDYDIERLSPDTQTPTSVNTDDRSQITQTQEDSIADSQYHSSSSRIEERHRDRPSPSPEGVAEDILLLKRFCLNLDETQDNLSKQLQSSKNADKDFQRELDDLRDTFKTFESRLSAVESSVQNRLAALESALQILLENQAQNNTPVMDVQRYVEPTSRKSNISVEIPVKRRHRSPSPKPVGDQLSQNISPPLSEEPTDESNKDTTSKSKHSETRTARSTKSQPRQAESTNPSGAQEAGGDDEKSRQARDDEGTRAETSIVISDDESDDDDRVESAAEHASKRARLNNKNDKKKQQQQQQQPQPYAKKKKVRLLLGSSSKQELRTDKPDENEDYNDQGTAVRVTRSKRSS